MDPRDPDALSLLRQGRIEVQGRIADASNATLLCTIRCDGVVAECVYKPVSGERPLWDFPDGTLAGREVATYLVSEAAGLHLVPPTVLRDGPFGPGMVQLWVDTDDGDDLVDVVAANALPADWRPVFDAEDQFGRPAVLAHADLPGIRLMAALDVVVNNADRKGGHVLHTGRGEIFGVDHGICLHTENKLRTVLWGFVGEPLPAAAVEGLRRLKRRLSDGASLCGELVQHIAPREVRALTRRVDRLLVTNEYPAPSGDWRAIPWPPF